MRTEAGVEGSTDADTKATGKGRRDIDDDLEPHNAQTFRQAAGTRFYLSIGRPSLQFAMSVVMSGMSEPKVVHQLQVVRVARYVLQHPGEIWLFNYQANQGTLKVCTDTDWAADELTRKSVLCTVERYAVTCLTAASRSNRWLHCLPERQSLTALSWPKSE